MTPQPLATQFKASSATNTGTLRPCSKNLSRFFNKAPPPVKKTPLFTISADNSGGVCSSTCLVALKIVSQVSCNADSISA